MAWEEIDRLTHKIEDLKRDNARLSALLYTRTNNQGGNPPPEIAEKLTAAGLSQEDLDCFSYTDEENGTKTLIRVKCYTTYDAARSLTRKEVTAVLCNSGWAEEPYGKWQYKDEGRVHTDLKLRDAYLVYHQHRGELPDPEPVNVVSMEVVPFDTEEQMTEAVAAGESCVRITFPDDHKMGWLTGPSIGFGRITQLKST